MSDKLNRVVHDPRAGTIFVSLRPRTHRRPVSTLEYPGRIVFDLDAEGDIYGVRLLGVGAEQAAEILERLKASSFDERTPGSAD